MEDQRALKRTQQKNHLWAKVRVRRLSGEGRKSDREQAELTAHHFAAAPLQPTSSDALRLSKSVPFKPQFLV
jgi:hypothetical protein